MDYIRLIKCLTPSHTKEECRVGRVTDTVVVCKFFSGNTIFIIRLVALVFLHTCVSDWKSHDCPTRCPVKCLFWSPVVYFLSLVPVSMIREPQTPGSERRYKFTAVSETTVTESRIKSVRLSCVVLPVRPPLHRRFVLTYQDWSSSDSQ